MKTETNTTYVVNESFRANSYEFGKAGNRFKLYFEDTKDLENQLNNLKEAGLINLDEILIKSEENQTE